MSTFPWNPDQPKGNRMLDNDDFYVVWDPSHGTPTVRHQYRQRAREEARRLAKLHPGRQFFVLRAIEFFSVADPVENVHLSPRQPAPTF